MNNHWHNTYEHLTQREFDKMRMLNNNVCVEIPKKPDIEKRASGILIIKDIALMPLYTKADLKKDPGIADTVDSMEESDLAPRYGIVAKLPDYLKFNYTGRDSQKMDWSSEIEIQQGDMVWFVYYLAITCTILIVENKKYWVFPYQFLIVAKRNEKIICLNGYCLFTRINEGLQSKFLKLKEVINKQKGIVKYVGSPNKEYKPNYNGELDAVMPSKRYDDIEVEPGDKVIFRNKVELILEPKEHRTFSDEDLRYSQRAEIFCLISNN